MKKTGLIKILSGAVILAAEILISQALAARLSTEIVPVWHRWSGRITLGIFAAFAIVSALIFLFCAVKGKKPFIIEIWGFIFLFLANTLEVSQGWMQLILGLGLIIHMLHGGLFKRLSTTIVILAVCLACALSSSLFVPAISKIQKPELYTTFENFWWNLFLTVTGRDDSSSSVLPPMPEIEPSESKAGIPDNMITNDVFPENDDTLICNVKSTYPLQMLHIYSCGEYNTATFTFSILDDPSADAESHSPSGDYYRQAVTGAKELPYKALITDYRQNKNMMLAPYCRFSAPMDGVRGFGDRYIYRNASRYSASSQFMFDPAAPYTYASTAYSKMVQTEYTKLPMGLDGDILHFARLHGLSDSGTALSKVIAVRQLLTSEYEFTTTPPALPEGEDPVMWFLLKSKEGHSKHFAAAEVFLYRAMGLPARYCVGYKIREYDDGSADVLRYDVYVYCEIFADGVWMRPDDLLFANEYEGMWQIGPQNSTEFRRSEDPVQLSNGYDISYLKGTASMFGSFLDGQSVPVSRNSRSENDRTVELIVDTGVAVDYIKAYSAGDYNYPAGTFEIEFDARNAPDFEDGKSFGEYARDAFMSDGSGKELPDEALGFRVFNLFAPRYIYTPVFTVSTEGLAEGQPRSFSMSADRTIVPLPADDARAYDDYTVFEGGEPVGANKAYTKYALAKYTEVPDEMRYYLTQFLDDNDIDPEGPDKGALMEAIRTLLSKYTYSTQIDTIPTTADPVMWFLATSRCGYCQHFASAATMLLRTCGIPARYVSGYLKQIPAGSITELTAQDTHAWTEVYNGSTWQLVDMCTGRPAEGQTLPPVSDAEEEAYVLPEVKEKKFELPAWTIWLIVCAAVCAVAVALAVLIRKHKPDEMQMAEIQYKYIKKYYYISDDIDQLLNKISYSRQGAESGDMNTLEQCYESAKSLLKYRRKYLRYARSMVSYALWYLEAVFKNARSSAK